MAFFRSLVLFLFTFLQVAGLWAQTAPTAEENSLLWEISGNDLQKPSYLFGTIHMIPAEQFILKEPTLAAFDQVDRVAFEVDTESMTNPTAILGMMDKMMMQGDTSLQDLLSDEEFKKVEDRFNEIGLPIAFLQRIKPMFLSVLAGDDVQSFAPENRDQIKSYELVLTDRAKEQEKDILGLETVDFQMSLFDSIPYRAQAEMLLSAVENGGESQVGSFEGMVKMYLEEDIVGMQSLMSEGETNGGFGNFEEILLLRRNRSWVPIMQQMMMSSSVFFAVGAGHLAGEEGVIALLRNAGYTLKPLRS